MSKKQIEESLNYKKYRTLSKVPDDILRKYQAENRIEETNNKKSQWKYWIVAVLVVVILGIGIFAGLNRRDDTVNSLNENDSVADEMVVEESQNILMADIIDDPEEVMYFRGELPVFGSEIDRREVKSITFLDTLDNAPANRWDVSYNQSGTVFAWVKEQDRFYDLYIAAEGGVKGDDCYSMFAGYSKVETINFNDCFDTSDVVYMDYMFFCCENLTEVDAENLDTENVSGMHGMFSDCHVLESLDVSEWDTHNLIDAGDMFKDCFELEALDVSEWDINSLADAGRMFDRCNNLASLDISDWNMEGVINVSAMFRGCNSLSSLDVGEWNTSNMTDMSWMFYDCRNLQVLEVSDWDTSNVKDMSYMFQACKNLTTLDISNWDTSNVTDMCHMFMECKNLTTLEVSNWDTSNVKDMSYMFYDCKSLTLLDTSNWDKSNVEDMHAMYYGVNESVLKQYK